MLGAGLERVVVRAVFATFSIKFMILSGSRYTQTRSHATAQTDESPRN
jgi:hypothetical protein